MLIRDLHDAFVISRATAERSYLGRHLTVDAYALSTGTSSFGTPIVMASDRPDGDPLAVLVLPYDDRTAASFARLGEVEPGQRLRVRGECRQVSEDGIVVFKDSDLTLLGRGHA